LQFNEKKQEKEGKIKQTKKINKKLIEEEIKHREGPLKTRTKTFFMKLHKVKLQN